MDKPGGFARAPPPPAAAATVSGGAASLEDLSCPCCFRPGTLCESFAPEEAAAKIGGLRVLLASHGLDAYVIPSGDAHSSEYVARCDERRAWLTGFTGSAGTALVTRAGASLVWTDGRYFNQAAAQLAGSPWTLMRQHEPGVLDLPEWCRAHLGRDARVGIDGALAPLAGADHYRERSGLAYVPVAPNLVDVVWGRRRPAAPSFDVVPHPLALTGESVAAKLRRVEAALPADASALCLNALDQIAWLANLRGRDIDCNPVFFAYAVVARGPPLALHLYLRCLDAPVGLDGLAAHEAGERVAATRDALRRHFENEGCGGDDGPAVALKPYAAFTPAACAADCGAGAVVLERASATLAMAAAIPEARRAPTDISPVELFKAAKNAVEIAGLRAAGLRDAAVLAGFFGWLEAAVEAGAPVDEVAASGGNRPPVHKP